MRAVESRPENWLHGAVAFGALLIVLAWASASQAKSAPESFADLVEKLSPAVVNISTTQVVQAPGAQEMPDLPPGSPFEDWFKEFFERRGGQEAQPRRAQSLGSGFIVDAGGYVVTNNHVIEGADEIKVILHDDTTLDAEIVGRDPKTDLALLKVKSSTPLTAVTFGDSDDLRVGDWVIAIGNPFGLGGTVTAGIVSARSRDIRSGPYDDFIQTDASINRGNSGGPMFDMDGKVVGVNTAIYSPSGGSVGIGFAVPSNQVSSVVMQLKEYGRTRRGWLGVHIQTVTTEIAEGLGLDSVRGALVASVNQDSPAAKAGIEQGDVILKFDGNEIVRMRELAPAVAATEIGKKVEVVVWRKGAEKALKVVLGELEENEKVASASPAPESAQQPSEMRIDALGVTLAALTDELRTRFELGDSAAGVVVVDVAPEGPAAENGLRVGDVVTEVGQERVTSPSEIARKVEQAKAAGRSSVLLLVEQGGRRGQPAFMALRIAKD
ncbi:MAG: DegQ family serine endoprotease [Proteobacteria bacterium]|nr:DegQ family serine endoprotease [Pseudomonadota bacterium]